MMRWSNLLVIFRREVLDQLRDRRTLFMIVVFPILLYPILGFVVLQVAAARVQKPRIVVVVGTEYLPAEYPLLAPSADDFDPRLLGPQPQRGSLQVVSESARGPWGEAEHRQEAVRRGVASAVLVIPADLPRQFHERKDVEIPILYRSVDETSQNTYYRLREILDRWKREIVQARTQRDNLPRGYAQPVQVKAQDLATTQEVESSTWSRVFPFLLVMMSLTGAFYPAVDLCAGEKERGTMETLLISPASRAEIVVGKFLTVMLASVATALLNLASMGLTGLVLAERGAPLALEPGHRASAAALSAPSLQSAFWMILLLLPLAAFFSAVCLALSVLARSMKEGQYYMTPLYMVCLPLIFLTLMPETKLNLFYSLVPVTGVALLLRALIMGDYQTAVRYFLPVMAPTVFYAWVALRWAIDQFQREDVLFREAERFSLSIWLKHLIRHRQPMPTGGQATLCFALILSSSWFLMEYMTIRGLKANQAAVAAGQFLILFPPLIMAVMLTSSPSRTLRLTWPAGRYFLHAGALALALNPVVAELGAIVQKWFPISSALSESLNQLMSGSSNLWISVGVFALLPAVCEEFAFRGFILSGLEQGRRTRSAILLSALMFGFLHVLLSLFQQLCNATLLGIVLGLLAIRSRSLLPGIVFHFLNNALFITQSARIRALEATGWAAWLYRNPADGLYHGTWIAVSLVVSGFLLFWLGKSGQSAVRGRRRAGTDLTSQSE
ncbi:MAG: ABC transporter permease subunit/CPBP intramembrane protease [Isosphaeraceae bacterium]